MTHSYDEGIIVQMPPDTPLVGIDMGIVGLDGDQYREALWRDVWPDPEVTPDNMCIILYKDKFVNSLNHNIFD